LKAGNLWFSTTDKLYKYDGTTWTYYRASSYGFSFCDYRRIDSDSNGNIWMYDDHYNNKLYKFDGNTSVEYDVPNFNDLEVYAHNLKVDSQNNIWISKHEGLLKFDGNNWTVYNHTNDTNIPGDNCLVVEESSDNYIYASFKSGENGASTYYGYNVFDGNQWTNYNSINSNLPFNDIYSFYILQNDPWLQDKIWMGTIEHGVLQKDGANWNIFNTDNSTLFGNWIKKILKDDNDNFWFVAWYCGISVYNPNGVNLASVEQNTLPDNAIKIYPNPTNGILHINSNENIAIQNIEIFDMQGRKVYAENIKLPRQNLKINLKQNKSGSYIINIHTDKGISRKIFLLK